LKDIREWLRSNIHEHGSLYSLREVMSRLGQTLSVGIFMKMLKERISEAYGTDF
jgi:Zn-dependent M32 family carboxypeptidase